MQKQKMNLLDQFGELTTKQLEFLRAGKYEEVLPLFDVKDKLMLEIDALNKELGEAKNEARLLQKLQELQELSSLLELELCNAKTAIGMKLVELQQNKQTDNKYQFQYTQIEGAFIDKKK